MFQYSPILRIFQYLGPKVYFFRKEERQKLYSEANYAHHTQIILMNINAIDGNEIFQKKWNSQVK